MLARSRRSCSPSTCASLGFFRSLAKLILNSTTKPAEIANAKLKTSRRPINAGELLTADDIDLDETYLEPPTLDGKRAAFFLCRSSFLNFITLFDFTPNAPPDPTGSEPEMRMRYPFADFAVSDNLLKVVQPIERFKQLADANWPPGPAYYPNVLWHVHSHPDALHEPGFADLVAKDADANYLAIAPRAAERAEKTSRRGR